MKGEVVENIISDMHAVVDMFKGEVRITETLPIDSPENNNSDHKPKFRPHNHESKRSNSFCTSQNFIM